MLKNRIANLERSANERNDTIEIFQQDTANRKCYRRANDEKCYDLAQIAEMEKFSTIVLIEYEDTSID